VVILVFIAKIGFDSNGTEVPLELCPIVNWTRLELVGIPFGGHPQEARRAGAHGLNWPGTAGQFFNIDAWGFIIVENHFETPSD
jgi:hypothetical protein